MRRVRKDEPYSKKGRQKDLSVPSKCDVEITECWYGEPLQIA